MTDFSVAATLEAQVSQSSLRSARQEIEDELGGIEVDISASVADQIASGSGAAATDGGQPLASSQLETATTYLDTATDELSENLGLNEERNTILRELLDAQELAAQESGGNNRLRLGSVGGLLSGGLGIAALVGAAIANVNWTSVVTGAITEVSLAAGDLIANGGQAAIEAGDLVKDKARVATEDVVDEAADVGASDVIDTTLGAGDLVEDALPIGAAALVASGLPLGVGALIGSALPVSEGDIVGDGFPLSASALLKDPLPVGLSAIVSASLPVTLGNLIGDALPVSIDDLIEQAQGEGSGEGSAEDTGDNTGDDTGDSTGGNIPWEELAIGGSIAIAGGALAKTALGSAGGATAGAGFPILPRGAFADIADEDTISPTGIGENIPEDERMTNREVILSTIASGQAPIMAGSMTSATGTMSPTPDPDASYDSYDSQNETSNSGPVSGLSDLPEKDQRLIRRVLSQQPSLNINVQFRDGGLAPDTRQRLQSRLDSSEDSSTAGGSGGSGGSADTTQSESSRGTPDRNQTNVEAKVTNNIEMPLEFRNSREFQKFVKDPEGYIEDVINDNLPGGR